MPLGRKICKALLGALVLTLCAPALAEEQFASPEAAIEALLAAARGGDKEKLIDILGPEGKSIISSGDAVADKNARMRFLEAYDKGNKLETEDDDFVVLLLGADDWPFPIPVVKAENGKWEFDTDAGLEEILIRRVGRNELSAIEAARLYVEAQEAYAALNIDGKSPPAYAQRIISNPGKKDGLFWLTEEGEDPSPLTKKVAEVTEEGYKPDGITPIPYHGYYFRILEGQGAGAKGGAKSYMDDGRMSGGFALIAHPAEYGNSGIMTFIVNQDGMVFEKDLGEDTVEIAGEIDTYAPDETWQEAKTP